MSIIGQNILAGSSGAAAAYTIDQSLRFNGADGGYLKGTYSGADATAATWSWWTKVAALESEQYFYWFGGHAVSGVGYGYAALHSTGKFDQFTYGGTGTTIGEKRSEARLRDPGAWYHLVVAIDTTLATAADRIKLYVNGVRVGK